MAARNCAIRSNVTSCEPMQNMVTLSSCGAPIQPHRHGLARLNALGSTGDNHNSVGSHQGGDDARTGCQWSREQSIPNSPQANTDVILISPGRGESCASEWRAQFVVHRRADQATLK